MNDFNATPSLDSDLPPTDEEHCGTREAAQLLGLPLGAVQNMVEQNLLKAWKTPSGVRRVSLQSIADVLNTRKTVSHGNEKQTLQVLVVEDDYATRLLMAKQIASWELPLECTLANNGLDAMIRMGEESPDIMISDLSMPAVDGFEMLQTLKKFSTSKAMHVVMVSGMSDEKIAERGGLPEDVTLLRKPIPFDQLKGYLQALVMQRRKALQL